MKMFFAKDVQSGIQRHMSVEDFCAKYDCTEDEFDRRLRQIYKYSAADDMLKRIRQSADKAKKKPKAETPTAEPVPESVPNPIPEPDPIATEVAEEDSFMMELRASEATLRDDIYRLEIGYEEHASTHRGYVRQIRTEKEQIDRLTSELKSHLETVEYLAEQNNAEVAIMNDLCTLRRAKKSDLADVLATIEELNRVKLYVEADGKIRVVSTSDVVLDDTGADALASELFMDQHFESCRVGAIRTAARVISVVRHLAVQAEVDFADDEVGIVFLEYADMHQT